MTTLQTSALHIRAARPDEAAALTALCIRSKAHWGYDADFMRASAAALEISPAAIARGRALVAEDKTGLLLGVATAVPLDELGSFDLTHFFIEPRSLRSGVGRALFAAMIGALEAEGGATLMILSDPFAAKFYERMGAKPSGDAPSDAIPGRRLPLLAFKIREALGAASKVKPK